MTGSLDSWEQWLLKQAEPHLRRGRPDDWDHTLRALRYGRALLQGEEGDPEIVITTLALHDLGWSRVDYADFVQAPPEKKKETRSLKEHMTQGALLAREILEPTLFPEDRREQVLRIIACHDEPETVLAMAEPEALLVMEADRLDRFGPESLARYRKMFGENYLREGRSFLLEGAKLWFRTPTARRILQEMLGQAEKSGAGSAGN
jgi:HD superfamily phosphodiesterase